MKFADSFFSFQYANPHKNLYFHTATILQSTLKAGGANGMQSGLTMLVLLQLAHHFKMQQHKLGNPTGNPGHIPRLLAHAETCAVASCLLLGPDQTRLGMQVCLSMLPSPFLA